MTWWILTSSTPVATFNTLTVRTFTNVEDHLFMAWAYHEPRRHLIYRTVRGKTILCGYEYIWDTPFIAEQIQEGDTLYHRFSLTDLQHNSTIWYYLWAPDGPYGQEIQGPLRHVTLPPPPYWPENLFIATKLKGVFATRTMSAPGEAQPTWIPLVEGLHSLICWQYAPDLLYPQDCHYLVAGAADDRILYSLDVPAIPWWMPFTPARFPDWQPLLTDAQAVTLTGSTSGTICWVATNIRHPGWIHVLFNSGFGDNGTWHIRSQDYGATWEAFQIHANIFNWEAGNIVAGISKGSSPYYSGAVLYVALCSHLLNQVTLWLSTDFGETWTATAAQGIGVVVPRCYVEPSDQAYIYLGALRDIANTRELWRSINHGAALVEVDADDHLGTYIDVFQGQLWLEYTDIHVARVLAANHVWYTDTFCSTWNDPGPTPVDVSRLSILGHSPSYLYLARHTNTPAEGQPGYPHVFFISLNDGLALWGKCGDHAHLADGGGDSIPGDCGGLAHDGILHPYPA